MALPFVALAAALLSVVFATRRLGAVTRSPSPGLGDAVKELRKVPAPERPAAAVTLTAEGTWEGALARALADAVDERDRVDAASEAVGDLAATYGGMSRWTVASVRIVLFVGLILVALGLARQEHVGAVAAFGVAGVGAMVTHSLGGRASRLESRQRELADAWVELLLGRMPERRRRG
jgi:hypothetical protein